MAGRKNGNDDNPDAPGGEVVVRGESNFAVVQMAAEAGGAIETLDTILRDNVGSGGITPFDLDRVKVPSGGSIAWELPTLTGEADVTKAFDGIVVAWREPRSYWEKSLDESGGGVPPDCSSDDGITGVGDPGGQCAVCRFAQFGSGKEGRGQKCKQMRLLFILREDSLLPLALFAPPTSIGPLKKYFMRLASQNVRYSDVVTTFALTKAQSQGGIDYARIEPSVSRMLDPDEKQAILVYSRAIAGATAGVRLTAEDVVETDPGHE